MIFSPETFFLEKSLLARVGNDGKRGRDKWNDRERGGGISGGVGNDGKRGRDKWNDRERGRDKWNDRERGGGISGMMERGGEG